jgi:hypothetical protein
VDDLVTTGATMRRSLLGVARLTAGRERISDDGMKRQPMTALSPKQERLAVLLATGRLIKDAASEVGISERQAHRWLDDQDFKGLVSRHRARLVDETMSRLVGIATRAVDTLAECLDSEESDSVRVRSAIGILDQLLRLREHSELEERLTELEGRLPGVKSQGPA